MFSWTSKEKLKSLVLLQKCSILPNVNWIKAPVGKVRYAILGTVFFLWEIVVPVTSLYKVIAKSHYSEHRRGFLFFYFHNFGPKKAYPCTFSFLNAMYLQPGNKSFHTAFSRQEHTVTIGVSPGSVGFSHLFYDTLICAWFSANLGLYLKNMGTLLSSPPDAQMLLSLSLHSFKLR